MTSINPYKLGLDKNAANHVSLSPLSFLRRAAAVYPNRAAIVYGERRQTLSLIHISEPTRPY